MTLFDSLNSETITLLIGAVTIAIGFAVGWLIARASKKWVRYTAFVFTMLVPVLLAYLFAYFGPCDERHPKGFCTDAGMTIMGAIALVPWWTIMVAAGFWLEIKRRQAQGEMTATRKPFSHSLHHHQTFRPLPSVRLVRTRRSH